MINLLNNTLELYVFSPQDQFGDDDRSVGLLNNMLVDLIPNARYIEELEAVIKALNALAQIKCVSSFISIQIEDTGLLHLNVINI